MTITTDLFSNYKETSTGSTIWSNPQNTLANDGSDGVISRTSAGSSQYLMFYNFDGRSSIPSDATIISVEMNVEGSATRTGANESEIKFFLSENASDLIDIVLGYATVDEDITSGTDAVYTCGGAIATAWSDNPTNSELNSAIQATSYNDGDVAFGIQLINNYAGTNTISVDYVELSVEWELSESGIMLAK